MAYSFWPFVLDTERRELSENGTEVHLSPKAYAFLSALVESRGRALSKLELHDRLWPGVFVLEANLTVVASEVRRALRDTARHGRFIRTIHGFGYAFVAEVREDRMGTLPPREALSTDDAGAARCWVLHGDRETMLRPGEHLIGRDPDVSVRLDLVTASRHHARLVVRESGVTILDLGSKNGTWLRGVRITGPVDLADGDEVLIGHARLRFRIAFEPAPTQSGVSAT